MAIENTHERGPRRVLRNTDNSFTESVGGDVAHDAADTGAPVKIGGKANASAPSAVTEGDRVDASFDLQGQLRVTTATMAVAGTVAHDAVDSGNPVKVGGKATTGLSTALPAAVSSLDRTDALYDEYGRLHVIAGGITDVLDVTITRPANATQYAAGDVIGDTGGSGIMTITGAARVNGGSGMIVSVTVIDSAVETVKPNLELYLFDTAPAGIADNAPWAPSDAEMKRLLGYIDLDNTPLVTANNCTYRVTSHNPIPFKCLAGSKDLYCVLVERGTYTPISGEVFTLRIGVSRD